MICNSGCRADASEAAIILLPSNITVFALDFSGSGLSGGEHVTLGWNEVSVKDIPSFLEYKYLSSLNNSFSIRSFFFKFYWFTFFLKGRESFLYHM